MEIPRRWGWNRQKFSKKTMELPVNLNFQWGEEGGENQKNPFMGEGWLGVDIFWKYTMEFPDKLRGTNHSTFHKRVT